MTLKEILIKVTPNYLSNLDDNSLKILNRNLHLANTLARIETRIKIKTIQNLVHSEMFNRGFEGIKNPIN